jgi:hypothetical protein
VRRELREIFRFLKELIKNDGPGFLLAWFEIYSIIEVINCHKQQQQSLSICQNTEMPDSD